MKRLFLIFIAFLAFASCNTAPKTDTADMDWWRESRFGMFVHWGIYSVPAGEWNGRAVPGLACWIQNMGQIPNSDYEKFAAEMSLANYNPEEWVKMAKAAGMDYLVFTSKHHDGFAMYKSEVSDFDIERTPYKGDPLKELADACRKYGVRFGLYYSQRQDWREEAAAYLPTDFDGHFAKPKSEVKPDFDKYMEEKALPQVRELLTRYGKIDVLWYDTPLDMTREQSKRFVDVVRELQPQCIINGRVGHNLGDYGPLGDNELPCAAVVEDLEMVATMNHTWGYKKNDNNWKNPKDLLCSLIECCSRGVNYMLNIGPMEDGTVPQPSVDILSYFAGWMEKNSECIYGSSANPFNDNFPWGFATVRDNKLYFQFLREPENRTIVLRGIESGVVSACMLADGTPVELHSDGDVVVVVLPEGIDYENVPVLKLVCDSPVKVRKENYMVEDVIRIPMAGGKIVAGEHDSLRFAQGRYTDNFNENSGKVVLTCNVDVPGTYTVRLFTSRHWRRTFPEGAVVSLSVDGEYHPAIALVQDGELANVRQKSYPESWSDLFEVCFDTPGEKTIELSVDTPGRYKQLGRAGEDTMDLETDSNLRVMRLELIHKP